MYTENQTSILAGIDLTQGAWYDDVVAEATVQKQLVKDRTTARRVLDQLIKKGTLTADTTVKEGSTWIELKDAPEDWFYPSPFVQDVEPGTPEAEVVTPEAEVVTHTENYEVREWKDADDTEWTETIFADKSRTIKRRKQVSGQWRTDYWGAEFEGDNERYTTAKMAKSARAFGTFTHNLI